MSRAQYTMLPTLFDENTNDGVTESNSTTMDFGQIFSAGFLSQMKSENGCNESPVAELKTNENKRRRAAVNVKSKTKKNKSNAIDTITNSTNDISKMTVMENNTETDSRPSTSSADNEKDPNVTVADEIEDGEIITNTPKKKNTKTQVKRYKGKKGNEISWKKFIEEFYNNATKYERNMSEGKTYKEVLSLLQNIFTMYFFSVIKSETVIVHIFSEQFLEFLSITEFYNYDGIIFNLSGRHFENENDENEKLNLIIIPLDENTLSMGNDVKIQEARRVFLENVIETRIKNDCISKLMPIVNVKYI